VTAKIPGHLHQSEVPFLHVKVFFHLHKKIQAWFCTIVSADSQVQSTLWTVHLLFKIYFKLPDLTKPGEKRKNGNQQHKLSSAKTSLNSPITWGIKPIEREDEM
jgi:hypothetical protein